MQECVCPHILGEMTVLQSLFEDDGACSPYASDDPREFATFLSSRVF